MQGGDLRLPSIQGRDLLKAVVAPDVTGEELPLGLRLQQSAIGAGGDSEVAVEPAVPEGNVQCVQLRVVTCGGQAGGVEMMKFHGISLHRSPGVKWSGRKQGGRKMAEDFGTFH